VKCGLCQQDVPKLAKSHVIAQAIATHGRPKGSQEPLLIVPSNKDQPLQRSRTGVYSKIVCPRCEGGFQAGDDALLALLRSLAQGVPFALHDGRPLGVSYPHADIAAVHRGVLSTLFRAHLSPHRMYQHVVLDPVHAERIRELLLSEASTLSSEYGVLLRVVLSDQATAGASPFQAPMAGVDVFRLFFPNLIAYIKVDEQPFDAVFQQATIGTFSDLHAILDEQLSPAEQEFFRYAMDGREEDIAHYAPKPKD